MREAFATLLLTGSLLASRRTLAEAPRPASPQVEDTIARTFAEARSHAHLRPLQRINDRRSLRQIVCTAAATGQPQQLLLTRESQADSSLFSITDLAHLPPDLARVAEYDDRSSAHGRRITRFSVAAFTSSSDPSLTWIGVALYWGRVTEFVASRLTHTYFPINAAALAPACLAVR